MKRISFLFLFVLLFQFSFSQNSFESGINPKIVSFFNKKINEDTYKNDWAFFSQIKSQSPKPLNLKETHAVVTNDLNGWSLNGNATSNSTRNAATASSYIGTPANIPINFKIGDQRAGIITTDKVIFGLGAGTASGGSYYIALGTNALGGTGSTGDVAIGRNALYSAPAPVSSNVAIGEYSMEQSGGNGNVAIGTYAFKSGNGSYNVAIGANAGRNKTGSNNVYLGNDAGYSASSFSESNKLYISNSNTLTPLIYGDFSAKFISIGDVPVNKRDAVAISGSYGLLVKKGILTEKVKIAIPSASYWADHVFEDGYQENMMSLDEIDKYTKKYKHLPNVPSATEMVKNGLDIGDMSRAFMEKIEELTLHLINMNKKMELLKEQIASLKEENRILQKRN